MNACRYHGGFVMVFYNEVCTCFLRLPVVRSSKFLGTWMFNLSMWVLVRSIED